MLTHYLKITLRNLWQNKSYSILNIVGLAIGITCAALIFLWVEDEVQYNNVHVKKDRLYFLKNNQQYDGSIRTYSSTPGLMGPAILQDIPGIVNTCRTSESLASALFTIGEKSMYASGKYADPSLFSMFTLPFVQGNARSAFAQLHSLVITEKTARNFFGDQQQVIGKTIRVNNKQDYVVTGVLKDLPANSSIQFDWVAPFEIYFQQSPWLKEWGNNSLSTYVELQEGVDPAAINKQLHNYIQKKEPRSGSQVFLFNMNNWRLYNQFDNGLPTGSGRIEYVHMFSIIAWIILFIACINFMNLATARSEKRAKEVGVRKVLGAEKKGLVLQYISEAVFMALLAAVGSVVLVSLTLPAFNFLVEKELVIGLNDPLHIAALLMIALICGLVAGSYPSLYLSAFKPVSVLKGLMIKTGSAAMIRKGLVVLQFTISIVLIISTIVIYQQIQHARNRQLGFDRQNLVEMDVQGEMANHFSAIKHDLLNTGLVENVSMTDHSTLYDGNNTGAFSWKGKDPGKEILISYRTVTPEYLSTAGMQLLEGRDFHENAATDSLNVIITESLAKLMGFETVVGQVLDAKNWGYKDVTVVGVVKDYVYGYMYGKPDPVIFFCLPNYATTVMYLRIKDPAKTEQALSKMEEVMKHRNPGYPFNYRFVDDQFNALFGNEMLISRLSRTFATLAIIISCLGLFGLAAYTAERRTKEIGIRKVLGASVAGITTLLSKDFLKLIAVAAIIAFPIAWWAMYHWLQGYPYRTTINWWVFIVAGILALLIALITISFQSVKAAMMNPVRSLRTE